MVYWMPSFRLASGLPQELSLPKGAQSASMMKLLLFGLPLALPLSGWGANRAGFALPQVSCHPKLRP